jgi:predicted nucleotidyltransferase component of viral defense system
VDLLGIHLPADAEKLQQIFKELVSIPSPEDGVVFEEQIETEQISKEGGYMGIRIHLKGRLESIRQRLQVDIGFGDIVVPSAVKITYPTLLQMAAPKIWAYSVESVIAEKFEAMLDLGAANSRMKDFYDVYGLLTRADYERSQLAEAVKQTCLRRGTLYQESHSLFTQSFAEDAYRQKQWQAFLLRIDNQTAISFEQVMEKISQELRPLYEALK